MMVAKGLFFFFKIYRNHLSRVLAVLSRASVYISYDLVNDIFQVKKILTYLNVITMISDNYQINICKSRHIPQLVELWKEYLVDQGDDPINSYINFDASTDGFRSILEGYHKKEPQGFFVATVGDEVVGFLLASENALSDDYVMKKKVGKIQVVHVKRGFRQRGIATSLLREAMGYLTTIGCSAALTETGETNTRSLKLLTRSGFKQRERLVTLIHEL